MPCIFVCTNKQCEMSRNIAIENCSQSYGELAREALLIVRFYVVNWFMLSAFIIFNLLYAS